MKKENHNPNNLLGEQVKGTEKQRDSKISLDENKYVKDPNDNGQMDNFIRVGHDYLEIVDKKDRYRILRTELKARKKPELVFDFGTEAVKTIKKYKDFTLVPDNINFKVEVDNCYNLYYPFAHSAIEGEWKWTKILLEQVFGEQFELGVKYIQALYQNPEQILPILVLISSERATGKSTFIDYLTILFGANMIIINSKNLKSDFNSIIAKANIIAVEETFIDKVSLIESIKALSTQKTITVNPKFTQEYSNPFYGKIIMTSNNELDFIKIDSNEIRFFVRKLVKPKFTNHSILKDLQKEIPAFLYYLNQQPALIWDKSRQLFTAEELKNDSLMAVQEQSKNWFYHELYQLFVEEFNNIQPNEDLLLLTITDIKERWFRYDNKVQRKFIKKVLFEDFGFKNPKKPMRYGEFMKTGRPYFINRDYFGDDVMPERAIKIV